MLQLLITGKGELGQNVSEGMLGAMASEIGALVGNVAAKTVQAVVKPPIPPRLNLYDLGIGGIARSEL